MRTKRPIIFREIQINKNNTIKIEENISSIVTYKIELRSLMQLHDLIKHKWSEEKIVNTMINNY